MIGQRLRQYEVTERIGEGGMGVVWRARDLTLGRDVALKVLTPDETDPGGRRERLSREARSASALNHPNIVTIYEINSAEGVDFIAMEYVRGETLASLIRRSRLSVDQAIHYAIQIAEAVGRAHRVGIVHRDLKPGNVMVSEDGLVKVLDFGLAKVSEASPQSATVNTQMPLTQAGVTVGTLGYMSPEQAVGGLIDARTDVFSVGVILYEMLSGVRPFAATSDVEAIHRLHFSEPAALSALRPDTPGGVASIVMRALVKDPSGRFDDLLAMSTAMKTATLPEQGVPPSPSKASASDPVTAGRSVTWAWMLGVLVVVVASAGGVLLLSRRGETAIESAASTPPRAMAVLPFRNASGDRALDWLGTLLGDLIRNELGNGPGLRLVSTDRVLQTLSDLRISAGSEVDPATVQRILQASHASLMVVGQYARVGETIHLRARVDDADRPASVAVTADAASENDLPRAIRELAGQLRDALHVSVSTAAKRSSLPGPVSGSIAALRAYSEGEQLVRESRHQEALTRFQAATKADPEFALAFAQLAQTYSTLGYSAEAQQMARTASAASERLSEDHRYVIEAVRSAVFGDTDKAIAAYERLEKVVPNDSQLLFELAKLYEAKGNLDAARATLIRTLDIDPNHLAALNLIGQVEIRRRDFDAALKYLQPAFIEAVKTGNEPAKGFSLHAIGVAFKRLNKPVDALTNFEQALKIRRALADRRGQAVTLSEIGQVQLSLQQMDAAVASFEQSLAIRQEIGDKRGVGNTLIELGVVNELREHYDVALDLFRRSLQIQQDLGNEAYQGLSLNNIASIDLLQAHYDDALAYFEKALQVREKSKVSADIAETLQGLGDTHAKIGQFDQAVTYYLRAIELRRAANDPIAVASLSYAMALVSSERGRYGAALEGHEAALKTLRDANDPRLLVRVLTGHASSLVMLGRNEKASESLREASALAGKIGHTRLSALTLNTQAEAAFYRGDRQAARDFAAQALQLARTLHPDYALTSALWQAKVDLREGRTRIAVSKLRDIIVRAERLRLRPTMAEATLYLGEALLAGKDLANAQRELLNALSLAENLTLLPLTATAHYLLSETMFRSGDATGAGRHLASARQAVETMRRDARTDELLSRDDLKRIVSGNRQK